MFIDDETVNIDVDALFKDEADTDTETNDTSTQTDKPVDNEGIDTTKAMSERINTVRHKTEVETQDKIAKELGYENYADLRKSQEQKLFRDAGLDDKDATDLVNKLVEQRLANDPRLKKLEEIEAKEKTAFVNSQLNEINKLPGVNFTSIDKLPDDTLRLFEKTGNLKQAYLATHGEELIFKNQTKGSTDHLANGSFEGTGRKTRALNDNEKMIWRMVNSNITDEELSKKTVDVE